MNVEAPLAVIDHHRVRWYGRDSFLDFDQESIITVNVFWRLSIVLDFDGLHCAKIEHCHMHVREGLS